MKRKVIHLITGLNTGGAEMMLYNLLSKSDLSMFEYKVISLTDIGPVGDKIKQLGIPVTALGMKRGIPNPFMVIKLSKILKVEKPDILQTWMYHADLLGFLAGKLAGLRHIIWGIHHSNLDPTYNKRMTILVANICKSFSDYVSKIICCSEATRKAHVDFGYNKNKMIVIPNGFDISSFKADKKAKESLLAELDIKSNPYLIGLIARWHPLKDHRNFLRAASLVIKRIPNIVFILCGDGITQDNKQLVTWIREEGLERNIYLLGRRSDVPKVISALDILSLSSIGEGFPNVLGEAMACEVVCVATDAGDSAYLIGETGFIVPTRDPQALADAWAKFLTLPPEEQKRMRKQARERIKNNFELELIIKKYQDLYMKITS